MNKVYYKGESYQYKVVFNLNNSRQYLLYKENVLTHLIDESELDKKPFLSILRGFADKEIIGAPAV